jgi:predicted metalloprotease with PDZ domain
MWRGGISGEGSIYLHADRPIRTPDRTSPPLHEAFHVLAPFRPGTDGLWITEGLAEYYSLELQRRIHLIDDEDFRRGLRSFRRWGRWDVNLSDDRSLAVTNNSAPYVIAAIDEWVRERTKDEHDLDDVLRGIVQSPEKSLTTAALLRIVKGVAGADLTSFVQRHVYAGKPPKLRVLSGDAHDDDR